MSDGSKTLSPQTLSLENLGTEEQPATVEVSTPTPADATGKAAQPETVAQASAQEARPESVMETANDNSPADNSSANSSPDTQPDSALSAAKAESDSQPEQHPATASATESAVSEQPVPPATAEAAAPDNGGGDENDGQQSLGSSDQANEKSKPDEAGEADEETEEEGSSMGLMEHFRELRNRLVKAFIAIGIGFAVCWVLRSYLVDFLYAPLLDALRATGQPETIIATGVAEKFFTYMKIAFVGGIFVGSPLIFYQLWAFIAPGLYDEEKVYIVPVAVASAVFFTMGGAFCYFMVFPNALPFLLGFGEEYMRDTPRLSEYYDFALRLLFAFGLIFELPLFIFFLARLGVVNAKMLSAFRRYFIVIAFIVGAILTPPDVMSQLLMAAPMLLLYEFSIIIAKVFGRDKKDKKGKKGKSQKNESQDNESQEADPEKGKEAKEQEAAS